MRFDAFFVDHPTEHWRCPVSGVPDQSLRRDVEARFDPIDHDLGGFDFRRAVSRCRFDIEDHAMGSVDQVVRRIGEEGDAAGGGSPT